MYVYDLRVAYKLCQLDKFMLITLHKQYATMISYILLNHPFS